MAEPAGAEAPPVEEDTRDAIREQLADLRRDVAELALWETQLVAAAHKRDLRRLAVDVAGPVAVALALLTAFGLANAAAVRGLSSVLSAWVAALVLAAGWVAVGGLLAVAIWLRGEHGDGLRWWKALTGPPEGALGDVREARERAERSARETLERLAPALAKEAASVAVPMASAVAAGMAAEMAGSAVAAGGDLLESSDELVESITQEVPGGGIVSQIWDVVLVPGRFGVRVATTVLRRSPPAG